jgi:hypothetical protein
MKGYVRRKKIFFYTRCTRTAALEVIIPIDEYDGHTIEPP